MERLRSIERKIADLEHSVTDKNEARVFNKEDSYEAARQLIIETQKVSTSFLQRRLGLGYAHAARTMDMLEEKGVIGPAKGAEPRAILIQE